MRMIHLALSLIIFIFCWQKLHYLRELVHVCLNVICSFYLYACHYCFCHPRKDTWRLRCCPTLYLSQPTSYHSHSPSLMLLLSTMLSLPLPWKALRKSSRATPVNKWIPYFLRLFLVHMSLHLSTNDFSINNLIRH